CDFLRSTQKTALRLCFAKNDYLPKRLIYQSLPDDRNTPPAFVSPVYQQKNSSNCIFIKGKYYSKIMSLFKIYLIICLCFFLVIKALNFQTIALLSFKNLSFSASKITYKHFYHTNLNRLIINPRFLFCKRKTIDTFVI